MSKKKLDKTARRVIGSGRRRTCNYQKLAGD